MKKYLFILLIVIFSLSLNSLGTLRVESIKELAATHTNLEVRDADGKWAPVLIVKTELRGLGFQNVSRPTKHAAEYMAGDHQYKFYMNDNQRVVKITHSDYEALEVRLLAGFGINVKTKRVYEIELAFDKEVVQVPVMISCNQSGAEVFIDSDSVGKTQNKMLTVNVGSGLRTIRIEKDGFASQKRYEEISITNNSFNFKLTPAMPAVIKINSAPEGATVTIDKNVKLGVTPFATFFVAGTYPIKIEKENYETINEQITITEPETKKHYILVDIRAILTVKTHPNATVKFNGKDYNGGIDKLVLLPQAISFRIEQEFCETIEETYTLKKGENKVFELYPENIAAIITIKTHPNATVKFNGNSFKGGVTDHKISPKVLEITVEMPKAETIIRIFTLKPKTTETIEIFPEVQTGTIQVMTIPTDASIELNGDAGEHYTAKGRNTFIDVPVGTYELTVTADEHKTFTENFNLIADDTVSKQITLEEGSDVTLGRKRHIIKVGDTFSKIADLYNLKESELLEFNNMKKEPRKLWNGAILWLEPENISNEKKKVEKQGRVVSTISKDVPEGMIFVQEGMIFIQGGTFQMGSNDGGSYQKPIHSVTVSDFYIGKYEVTQKEWTEIMGKNLSNWKGDNLPVEKVSWYDAVKFCNKKSDKEGLTRCYSGSGTNTKCNFSANGYRLPTEAEWEYSARGGNKSKGYKYSGSHNIGSVALYDDNSGSKTHKVGTKQPNELGIYDMSGNVWEWCWDVFGRYSGSSQTNPTGGVDKTTDRVTRGGSWGRNAGNCWVAARYSFTPSNRSSHMGFRLLRSSK